MTAHFPSFSIAHWPGCSRAKLQAVQTADRKLCAAVTAVASYDMTGRLYGTLAQADGDAVFEWAESVCREAAVTVTHFACWTEALCGHSFFDDHVPAVCLGLTLDTYQQAAIRGLSCAGGVIGAFMGAGKTVMATAAAIGEILARRDVGGDHPGRCWVFCPLNAMPAWEDAKARELSRYFREVKILSIDSAHKYTAVAIGDVLIIDECHRCGSGLARRTKALHTIRSRFRFCLCLTGTMVHAGVAACLSIKDLAVPGLALFAKTWAAGETFECIVRKKLGARTVAALEKPPSHTRGAFLEWLSIGVQLLTPDNREVQSAFKLPGQDIQEVTLNDPWPPLEQDVARVANAIFAETGEFPHAQAVAHRLARDGVDKKLEWLAGELSSLPDQEPVVVFAQYRDTLDRAEELLRALGRSYVRVDGDVVGADRAECQRRFRAGEVATFLGQIHAASESMNLQNACISIALDVSWSCIDYAQALARTRRRGQENQCIHVDLAANYLQARILDRIRSGQDFAAECSDYQEIKRCMTSLPS